MVEDKLLVWKLRRGDKKALRQIYEKYKDELLTIATSLLSETNEAEDVLHDVFTSFAKAAKQHQLYGSIRSYLIISVINRIRDRFRKKMYQVVELDRAGQIETNSNRPEKTAIENEKTQILVDALAEIPFKQREVIILHLKGGMKFREIAEIQNASINTIRARYQYGLDKLRSILNGTIVE